MPKQKQSKWKQFRLATIDLGTYKPDHLLGVLNQCAKKQILVVGDIGLDRYTIGSVERISPEAPVPIVLVEEEQLKLGLAANVADNIRVLGSTPLLMGVIGKDRDAEDFCKLLKKIKISTEYLIQDRSRRTILKERVVSDRQQLVRIDYESRHPIDQTVEGKMIRHYKQVLRTADAVVIEDYAKGTLTSNVLKSILEWGRKSKKLIAIDPNIRTPLSEYQGATLLTPNTREAESLSGIRIEDPESLVAAGIVILEETQAQYVVITRGKDGMAIFQQGSPIVRLIPTYAQEVYDVSGAGDTVISVLTLALTASATIEEACILGNLAAGVEVGKRGTATVTPEEIKASLEFFLA